MRETLGQHTDHGVRFVVEHDVLADNIWIGAEALLPRSVTYQRDWSCSRLVVLCGEIAAHERARAHHFEVIGRNHSRVDVLRFVAAGYVHEPAAERRHRFKRLVALAPVEEVAMRNPAIGDLRA